MLQDYPGLKSVRLCLDHDIAGMEAAARIQGKLDEAGYTDVKRVLSEWKDWNEDIKASRGMEAIPAGEEPPPVKAEMCLRMA